MATAWRVAESLRVLFDQVNAIAPKRSHASDGTIGDAAHQGTDSDHNPRVISGAGSTPVVTAADITHDPADGADMDAISDALRASEDPRIKYVIFNRLIMSGSPGPLPWVWRAYDGDNPHDKHMHVSVIGKASLLDDITPWSLGGDMDPLAVWKTDGIARTIDGEKTDEWTAETFLNYAVNLGRDNKAAADLILSRVTALEAAVAKLVGQAPLDPAAVAREVLAGLPDDVAKQIADELSARLAA